MSEIIAGRYRHFKGMEYEVLGVATHSETGEPLVVYRALYGEHRLFVRPAAMFGESVSRRDHDGPRFTWLGPSTELRLSRTGQLAARAFLLSEGRPLEQALYRYHFEAGDAAAVIAVLEPYCIPDGGFGHALEPDLRTPDSSVLASTTALQTLRSVSAPADHPLVRGALDWLAGNWQDEARRWPLIPPTANNAAHAPWWTVGPEHATMFGGYLVNPFAEVVAHLLHYRPELVAGNGLAWDERAVENVEALDRALNLNELLCAQRLAETDELRADLRNRLMAAICASLPETLSTTPDQWRSYGLQPRQVAPSPQSPFAAELAPQVAANLDFLIGEQGIDGAWSPSWTWGDLYPEMWPTARRDWQSVLTLEALLQLSSYGRFAL